MIKTTFKAKQLRIIDSKEARDKYNCPVIVGQVGQVDVVSPNGYRYKSNFWVEVLNNPEVKHKIENRELLGTIEHPTQDADYLITPYEQASHVLLKAWVENYNPFAILGLLNNEKGNALKALIDVGHKPGVSTRGMGQIIEDSVSKYVSNDNYQFLGWDIVSNPNFSNLHMDKVSDSSKSLFNDLCAYWKLSNPSDIDRKFRELIRQEFKNMLNL